MAGASDGRVVWNHSTHIPGLIPILEKLATRAGVTTITPGAIARVRSHAPHLRLKISVPTRGGYKLLARKGKSVQEVFIITDLSQTRLESAIAELMG